jgi:hypothetical protein
MSYCPVCKQDFDTNYCPTCGQRKTSKKVSFNTFASDLFNNIYALDKSIFSNLKLLLTKPGLIINSYIDGYRNYYASPGKLFIVASLLVAITFKFTESSFFAVKVDVENSSIAGQFLFLFIFILLLSWTSYLTYYLKWKKNFTEHVVITVYNTSLWTILFLPLVIIDRYLLSGSNYSSLFVILYLLVIVIWNNRVFPIGVASKRVGYIILNLALIILMVLLFDRISEVNN